MLDGRTIKDIERERANWTHADTRRALDLPGSFGTRIHAIGRTWALGPVISSRDSHVRERANAIALKRELERIGFQEGCPDDPDDDPTDDPPPDYWIQTASHWAVGWVEHVSYRVLDPDGRPSAIACWLARWFGALADYPVADDSLLSEMEWNEWMETVETAVRDFVRQHVDGDPTDGQIGEICYAITQGSDETGHWPQDSEIEPHVRALGLQLSE